MCTMRRFFILIFKSSLEGYYGTNEIPFDLQTSNLKEELDHFVMKSEQ